VSDGSRNFEKGRHETVYQPRCHSSQVHTMNNMLFIRGNGDFLKKKSESNSGGRPHPSPHLNPPLMTTGQNGVHEQRINVSFGSYQCTACSVELRLSLSTISNPDLKLICFLLLSANYSTYLFRQRLCSHLTVLRHFLYFVLIMRYYYFIRPLAQCPRLKVELSEV